MKCLFTIMVSLAVLAVIPASTTPASGPEELGLRFGINLAGFDKAYDLGSFNLDNRRLNGAIAGVSAGFPLAKQWSFRGELLYSMKGGDFVYTLQMGDTTGTIAIEIRLNYLEIPLLLEFTPGDQNTWRPFFFAGPAMAINLQSKAKWTMEVESQGQRLDYDSHHYNKISNTESIQYMAIFGAGVEFDWGPRTVALEGRYTVGLHKAFDGVAFLDGMSLDGDEFIMIDMDTGGGANLKHNVISISVALYFPL